MGAVELIKMTDKLANREELLKIFISHIMLTVKNSKIS